MFLPTFLSVAKAFQVSFSFQQSRNNKLHELILEDHDTIGTSYDVRDMRSCLVIEGQNFLLTLLLF